MKPKKSALDFGLLNSTNPSLVVGTVISFFGSLTTPRFSSCRTSIILFLFLFLLNNMIRRRCRSIKIFGVKIYIFGILFGCMDLREAIGKVMMDVHRTGGLAGMGMDEKGKVSSHVLSFDSQQNQLEPIYYWILDFAAQIGWGGMQKTIDNFMASPGSGQFSEMNMKATKMQEEGMKILGGMNQIVKSILNLIYDLKEFELRLASYDAYNSKDKKEEGTLALKQIWLDNVDMKKGRGAIHSMASAEMGFSTLREAFMMANSVEDVKKMNRDDKASGGSGGLINESVMRILIPRIEEFNQWVKYSESELRKRFSIEKNYLKSQVETVKLYSAWMKPYLEAAEKLRQQGFEKDAALVNAFSTSMFELQLFGAKKVDIPNSYNARRRYNKVIIITMKYRGHVSQRVTQKGDYGFGQGGVVDIWFDSYALNDEELAAAKKFCDKSDLEKSMEFSMDVAGDALKELKSDLDYFLKSPEERERIDFETKKKQLENGKGNDLDINPFSALFGTFFSKKKDAKKGGVVFVEAKDIKGDNFFEKKMRADAISGAASTLYTIYDVYKKAHRMASAPGVGFDNIDSDAVEGLADGGSVGFFDAFKKE